MLWFIATEHRHSFNVKVSTLNKLKVACYSSNADMSRLLKRAIEKKLLEITIFLWNAILGNICFTTIAENSNIYFFIKSTHFFSKITPHLGD